MKKEKYYKRLNKIRQEYPELTFNNNGYEYLSSKIKEKHKKQIEEISEILKDTIPGFERFDNFRVENDGAFSVRIQCNYSHGTDYLYFIGVDYIDLENFKNLNDEKRI